MNSARLYYYIGSLFVLLIVCIVFTMYAYVVALGRLGPGNNLLHSHILASTSTVRRTYTYAKPVPSYTC